MANTNKILNRLKNEYDFTKTFNTETVDSPVYFACNMNDNKFHIVSIFMDSEIGGVFTIDDNSFMKYVYEGFDTLQAEDLIKVIIGKIETGEAHIINPTNRKEMH